MHPDLKVLTIGCGSIGQRNIRIMRALGATDIWAFDSNAERLDRVTHEYGVFACPSVESGLASQPDAVLVCTPPYSHTLIAQQAIDVGAHVFVEKPIAHTLDGLDDLLRKADDARRVLYVAYNLRFHAGLLKLKNLLDGGAIGKPFVIRAEVGQYLPDWRPTQDYRAGYNVSAAMGGGIILDASHELDYVRWLCGEVEGVYCAAGHLSDLEMDTEDTAAITLRFSSGMIGQVHLDCIQRGYARSCKIIGSEGTLFWEFKEGVRHLLPDKTWHVFPIAPDPNEMYLSEMRHFMGCIRGEEEPLVDGATGKRVLEIALAAKKSAADGMQVVL